MSLKQLLSQPVEVRKSLVEYNGITFVVEGKCDSTLLQECLFLPEEKKSMKAKVISKQLKWQCNLDMIANLLLIQYTLKNTDSTDPTVTRYDIIDIAKIARDHGVLYLKLLSAAIEVLDLKDVMALDDEKDAKDAFAESAVKN